MARRLRERVTAAGGAQVVAESSGVPLGTLRNYLSARTGMKMATLRALAAACGTSLDWLVGGNPSRLAATAPRPSEYRLAGLSETQASLLPPPIEHDVDLATLAKAIEVVAAIDGTGWQDDSKAVAQRIAAAYAVLCKPPAGGGEQN